MIKVIKHENMGRSDRGWLHSLFHFSFAEYYKPAWATGAASSGATCST